MRGAGALPRPADGWALFLDVDGTLIEIADTPEAAAPAPGMRETLAALGGRFGGAVALISGRSLETLDRLFAPLRPVAAGLHGLERRDAAGHVVRPGGPIREIESVGAALRDFARRDPGLLVEDKGPTVALHFRRAPGMADEAGRFARALLDEHRDRLVLQRGKMVLEFRPPGAHKGDVVEEFMVGAPFRGRLPVFVGDDVTDEDGFAAVNRLGGHSIRVGDADRSSARWRIASVAELHAWLDDLAAGAGRCARMTGEVR